MRRRPAAAAAAECRSRSRSGGYSPRAGRPSAPAALLALAAAGCGLLRGALGAKCETSDESRLRQGHFAVTAGGPTAAAVVAADLGRGQWVRIVCIDWAGWDPGGRAACSAQVGNTGKRVWLCHSGSGDPDSGLCESTTLYDLDGRENTQHAPSLATTNWTLVYDPRGLPPVCFPQLLWLSIVFETDETSDAALARESKGLFAGLLTVVSVLLLGFLVFGAHRLGKIDVWRMLSAKAPPDDAEAAAAHRARDDCWDLPQGAAAAGPGYAPLP
eukprot:TRINITY_DN10154_c2_g1_i2.p2 TRINITY_DN10154_c2_g1~~TRINITY_DN10154_c2_g1_i2.p2  ORF type:complete len:272 (+),score=95.13 TRINITY_DN10154_c2_g1_i2:59-874(+)